MSTVESTLDSPPTSTTRTSLETFQTTSSTVSALPLSDEAEESSPRLGLVVDLVSHVAQIYSSTRSSTSVDGHDQDDDDAGAAQRRDLLIGVICLSLALLIVLGLVGYFFYRVN